MAEEPINTRHLNYNHLLYFWTVAREGSVARAAEALHLTPQTISGQVKLLEQTVGAPLFQRVGRGLTLTETGRNVMPYAEEIFSVGAELAQSLRSGVDGRPSTLQVGIVNAIPKLIAYRTLEPILLEEKGPRLSCTEGELDVLLAELAVHKLDLILSDRPVPTGFNLKAYTHKLGDSEIGFFARGRLATRCRNNFPASIDDVPMLLPDSRTAIRRGLDQWLSSNGIRARVVAEFDDSALMKAFGESGTAIFPAPMAIATEVKEMYGASHIGTVHEVREQFYAISPQRKLSAPDVIMIVERARQRFQ